MSLRPLVIGNWKMNGTPAGATALGSHIAAALHGFEAQVEVALCPPYPLIAQMTSVLATGSVQLGAQDVSLHPDGAYTGEVSARLLGELGCRWVIVGHSERRSLCGETSEMVARKAVVALKAGLQPVVCVGESLEERESHATEAVIAAQLAPLGELLSNAGANAVIAYEPVWAIGTGRTASPEQAGEVHAFIRERLASGGVNTPALRILYGGSVKPDNAASLFAVSGIDGGLIGGASLKAADFVAICQAAAAAHASS